MHVTFITIYYLCQVIFIYFKSLLLNDHTYITLYVFTAFSLSHYFSKILIVTTDSCEVTAGAHGALVRAHVPERNVSLKLRSAMWSLQNTDKRKENL